MLNQINSDTLPGPSISSKPYSEVHLKKTKRRSGTKGEKGVLFEKKILMLVLHRACEEGLDFNLDTNVPGYGVFDDIVFVCRENDRNNEHQIYGQLKHKESKKKKITFEDLLKPSGDFSLYKYFIDYINILKNHKVGEKHFIIYTNADFHCPGPDEYGYRIHKKTDAEYFVFKVLDTSNCKPLAVFDTGQLKSCTNFMKKQKKKPTFYQFSDDTVNGLGGIDRVKLMLKGAFHTNDINEKKLQMCEKELDMMLENFLKAFVFAIDQFDEVTLGDVIREQMRQSHPDYQAHYVFLYALDEIGLWKNRNAPPLTEKNNYFKKGIVESENFHSLYPVLKYENELSLSNIRFTQQEYENIKDFITSRKQLWHITSDGTWLNSLLIYQALNQKALYEFSKINYSSHDHHILLTWNHLIEGHPFLLSLFENMKESILVIACTKNDLKDGRICEMAEKIANVVSEPQKYLKQIILIAPNDCELASMLTAKLKVFSHKTQKVTFDHLTKQSQDDCLTKENVQFQGNEKLVSIQQLMRVKEGYCVSEAFKNLNLDVLELEKLLKNNVVEIGNDQPELSELESMHIKPLSIIKAGDLKRAITGNLQDIFALVATEKEIEKLLPENEKSVTFEKWLELSNMSDFYPQSKRIILLKRSNKEDKQFKQLCRLINQSYFRKFEAENIVLPVLTLHLLKEKEREWIWMRSYSRELYIHRHFYPFFINRLKLIDFMLENSLLYPVKSNKNAIKISLKLSEFIIISEITPATFLDSLDINSRQVQEQIQKFVKRLTTEVNTENKSELSSNEYSANQPNVENETFLLILNNDYKTVFLENSEAQEEFQRLSSDSSNFAGKSVHWLEAVNDNGQIHYQWYRSAGQINRIRTVLDDERKHSVSEKCLLDNNAPIIVIADEPGMGKSTTLVSIAEMRKESNPWLWVIKIDLNQHQETLAETGVNTLEDLIDLLSTIEEKFRDLLTRKILRHKLTFAGDVLFLCDGYDEVKRERHEAVLSILGIMRRETAAKIFITTRPYCKEELEKNLSVLAHLFQPIDEAQQIDYLSHFWQAALKLTFGIPNLSVLRRYASNIIKKFRDCILDDRDPRSFVSVPLRARMLADIFRETIENALRGNETALNRIESREKIYIGNLFDQFIEKKYKIYFLEKIKAGKRFEEEHLKFFMNSFTTNYGVLALENIFGCKIAKHLNMSKKEQFSFDNLSQIGLIQGNNTTYNFIHLTFAEYFAGRWLADAFQNSNARRIICEKLLMKEYKVLRYFFDYFMSEDIPLLRAVLHGEESEFSELLIQNANVRDGLGRTAMHLAAQEGRVKMIDGLQKKNMSLVADETGRTPLHYAAAFDLDIEVVKSVHVGALLKNLTDIDLNDHIFKSPLHFDMDIGFSIFKNSVCEKSNLVKTVNKRDGAEKSALGYAAENQHWDRACAFVLHGADISFLTEGQKKELLIYAAKRITFGFLGLEICFKPVAGLLSIHVPEADQDLTLEIPVLLSKFFAHTKVIDSLIRSLKNTERKRRIFNYTPDFSGLTFFTRSASCLRSVPSDEDCLKIIKYYDLQWREELDMRIAQADIRNLLYPAAKGGFLQSFRYLYELYLREKRVESVFCPEFLQDISPIINHLYSNVQDLKYDDKWFQDLTSECSRLFDWSQLHFAATNKYINSIEEFVDGSIFDSLKSKDIWGQTPLLAACKERGRSKFIENLFLALKIRNLDNKYQLYEIIDTEDNWGTTPLHWVICNSDKKSAKALLSNMYDIGFDKKHLIHILTHRDAIGKTPMYGIRTKKIARLFMEYLKKFDFSSEEYIDILKSSDDLLHRLIRYREKTALVLLIGIENLPLNKDQRTEIVNWPGEINENTPLHEAAARGCLEVCREIVLRLFRNGAMFNPYNSLGKLPLDLILTDHEFCEYEECCQKTCFLLDFISSLFELVEDHQISQNFNKLDKLKTILYEIRGQWWIDHQSILNARNREKQTLRDVNKDRVVDNLLQEYEKHYLCNRKYVCLPMA